MSKTTDTPLTDKLKKKYCAAYTAHELERAFDDAVNRHLQLERQLAEMREERDAALNAGHKMHKTHETELTKAKRTIRSCYYMADELAEARKDTERLDCIFNSDWLYIDFEYWNPGKERYDTRMVNSRELLDEAITELRNGGDAAIRNSQTESSKAPK